MRTLLFALVLVSLRPLAATPSLNFNTAMVESTVKITTSSSLGTGFIVGRPDPAMKPDTPPDKQLNYYVLVTANHVFAECKDDFVTITLHHFIESTGVWERLDYNIAIRKDGAELWSKQPENDVAAINVTIPKGTIRTLIVESMILTDKEIEKFELGPGTPVMCLGFPLGVESNAEGFAILRSARIASYPLLPTNRTKTFYLDFNVFGGNSGGPVFLYETNPTYGGSTQMGGSIMGIVGLISQQEFISQTTQQINETRTTNTPLALGIAVHGSFIRSLIDSMPLPIR